MMLYDKNAKPKPKQQPGYRMPVDESIASDVEGSYTGLPFGTLYDDVYEEPVQDADDL